MPSRYASLTRDELATLVPELLLIGQLIDRSGMAWCISAFGREEMAQIAIEEWAGASPFYTRRMQRAMKYEGTDIITIFKGLQLDIGAPPQFMDFRYAVTDPHHGEFWLDHCGALMDVEPMGEEYVRSMCHDIEDPTFDATAVATNAKAQVRPVHRPPRSSVDQHPHCRWTVIIDETYEPVSPLPPYYEVEPKRAVTVELDPVELGGGGLDDYSGPLVSDVVFGEFSKAALVRMADEICLQMHLLNLSFGIAVAKRATASEQVTEICTKQLIGIAGIAAERIHRALDLPADEAGALRALALHPFLNPVAYVGGTADASSISVAPSDAAADGGWVTLCGPGRTAPLQAAVRAIDPFLDVAVTGTDDTWTLTVVRRDEAANEAGEVAVTRFSTGSTFAFEPRRSLPLFPV
ncbi:hypothetical protein BH09ACT12_BH09ACT12_02570 [soil metagenome]